MSSCRSQNPLPSGGECPDPMTDRAPSTPVDHRLHEAGAGWSIRSVCRERVDRDDVFSKYSRRCRHLRNVWLRAGERGARTAGGARTALVLRQIRQLAGLRRLGRDQPDLICLCQASCQIVAAVVRNADGVTVKRVLDGLSSSNGHTRMNRAAVRKRYAHHRLRGNRNGDQQDDQQPKPTSHQIEYSRTGRTASRRLRRPRAHRCTKPSRAEAFA